MALDPRKTYQYRAYDEQYNYIDDWTSVVTSTPSIKRDVNNFITSMTVDLGANDLTGDVIDDILLAEDSDLLELEMPPTRNYVLSETDNVSIGAGGILDTDYNVEIDAIFTDLDYWQTEDYQPFETEDGQRIAVQDGGDEINATQVVPLFKGYVSRFGVNLKGTGINATIKSHSQELTGIKYQDTPLTVVDNSGDATQRSGKEKNFAVDGIIGCSQSFTLTQGARVDYVKLLIGFDPTTTNRSTIRIVGDVTITSSKPNDIRVITGELASAVGAHNITPAPNYYYYRFKTPGVTLTSGTYYLNFVARSTDRFQVYQSSVNLPSETVTYWNADDTSSLDYIDLDFGIYGQNFSTVVSHQAETASSILRSILEYAKTQGVFINYDSTTITETTTNINLKFKNVSLDQAIKKVLEQVPPSYYSYFDVGTGMFYLKDKTSDPGSILITPDMVTGGSIEKSVEEVVNKAYFIGGKPTETSAPIYTVHEDDRPITRQRFADLSDKTVTTTADARAISVGHIDRNRDPKQSGSVTIMPNNNFNIEDAYPGIKVIFSGFGSYIDSLNLEASSLSYAPNGIKCSLAYIKPRLAWEILNQQFNVKQLQEIGVPNAPTEV